MNDFAEGLFHWQKDQNKTRIAASLGISRPTVRKYLKIAQAAGLTKESGAADLARALDEIKKAATPTSVWPGAVRQSIACHEQTIKSWLDEPDMTAKQIKRLLAEQGEVFSYTSIKRYVRQFRPSQSCVATVRLETAAGEQAQVDFGQVTLLLGEIRKKVWAFVMVLSYSRHRFVRFVERQDTTTWLDCHIRAFEFFDGCPKTVLLDNLKAGVVKTDLHDPTINRAYAELERHYGFVADPAKVRTPEHKGKVERSMPTVRQQLVAGRQYLDLADANEKALAWSLTGIGMDKHGTTHEEPVLRFERDERACLIPLPGSRFESPLWLVPHRGRAFKDSWKKGYPKSRSSCRSRPSQRKVNYACIRRQASGRWRHECLFPADFPVEDAPALRHSRIPRCAPRTGAQRQPRLSRIPGVDRSGRDRTSGGDPPQPASEKGFLRRTQGFEFAALPGVNIAAI